MAGSSAPWIGSAYLFLQSTCKTIVLPALYESSQKKPSVFKALKLALAGTHLLRSLGTLSPLVQSLHVTLCLSLTPVGKESWCLLCLGKTVKQGEISRGPPGWFGAGALVL